MNGIPTLIQPGRADYIAGVAHTECERTIQSRQRTDFECHVLTDVIDDPHIARGIIGSMPWPTMRPESLMPNAATKKLPFAVVCVMIVPPPPV